MVAGLEVAVVGLLMHGYIAGALYSFPICPLFAPCYHIHHYSHDPSEEFLTS